MWQGIHQWSWLQVSPAGASQLHFPHLVPCSIECRSCLWPLAWHGFARLSTGRWKKSGQQSEAFNCERHIVDTALCLRATTLEGLKKSLMTCNGFYIVHEGGMLNFSTNSCRLNAILHIVWMQWMCCWNSKGCMQKGLTAEDYGIIIIPLLASVHIV